MVAQWLAGTFSGTPASSGFRLRMRFWAWLLETDFRWEEIRLTKVKIVKTWIVKTTTY